MPFQEAFVFPPDEEVNVQELNVSLPTLKAGGFHFYRYCEKINHEYILCKQDYEDPRACLQYANEVTKCALEFFRKVKKNCLNEINANAECLYKSSSLWEYNNCRKSQAALDDCMLEKLNIERPHFGEPLEVHVIETDRPRPPPAIPEFPDAPRKPAYMETGEELPKPRFGNNRHFPNWF